MGNTNLNIEVLLRHQQHMQKLAAAEVKVGIQHDAGEYPDGTRLIDVAIWNHYGTRHIPARPFLTATVERYRERITEAARRFAVAVQERRMTPTQAHGQLGLLMSDCIRRTMRAGPWTPLSPATIQRKGSSVPLFDTSFLVNSIRHEVVPR